MKPVEMECFYIILSRVKELMGYMFLSVFALILFFFFLYINNFKLLNIHHKGITLHTNPIIMARWGHISQIHWTRVRRKAWERKRQHFSPACYFSKFFIYFNLKIGRVSWKNHNTSITRNNHFLTPKHVIISQESLKDKIER